MQIRLIFSPPRLHPASGQSNDARAIFLYGDFFDFTGPTGEAEDGTVVPLPRAPIDMFSLRRRLRNGRSPMSDIVRLSDVLEVVQLVPMFGAKMNAAWDHDSSMGLANDFYLNNFANKNTFHALLTYQ